MLIFISLAISFLWLLMIMWLIFLQGNEIKKTQMDSLSVLHFVSLSNLFTVSGSFDALEKDHKSFFENLVHLMYAYKRDISLEEIAKDLKPMAPEEKDEVLASLKDLFNSSNEDYQKIARFYVTIQAVWGAYDEIRRTNSWQIFFAYLKFTIYYNLSTFDRLNSQVRDDENKVRKGQGLALNYDYSVA